jgi:hypothetical protein
VRARARPGRGTAGFVVWLLGSALLLASTGPASAAGIRLSAPATVAVGDTVTLTAVVDAPAATDGTGPPGAVVDPPAEGTDPPAGGAVPPVPDPAPPTAEPDPPVVDPDPPVVEPDPPVVDPEPPVVEPDPPVEEPDPPVEEPGPPVEEPGPPVEEPDPPVEVPDPAPPADEDPPAVARFAPEPPGPGRPRAADPADEVTVDQPEPPASVTFTVSGANAATLVDTTGEGGTFSVTYLAVEAGTDTVVAVAPGIGSDARTVVVTAAAEAPPGDQTVALAQSSATSDVGTEVQLTVTVPADAPAGRLTVTVAGQHPQQLTVSGEAPRFTAAYAGSAPGQDTITAVWAVAGESVSARAVHTWVQVTLSLDQPTAASGVGEPLVLTATVVPRTVQGAVTFTASGAGPDLTFRDDRAADGFTASYTRADEGTDTVTAVFEGSTTDRVSVQHRWSSDPPPAVVLSPAGATSCTGSTFAPTVSLTGEAAPGAPVQLSVGSDAAGAAARTLTGTTGQGGRTSLPYTRATAGRDTVVATVQVGGSTLTSAPLTHVWEDCGITVTLGPPGTTSTAGTPFTATVHVTGTDGTPVPGAQVGWDVTMEGQPPVTPLVTTDEAGMASATWTRPGAGTDRIGVTVSAGIGAGSATTDHFWTAASDVQLTLAPVGASSVAGSSTTIAALATRDGQPLPGIAVRFRAGLPVAVDAVVVGDVTGEALTGEDGQALFTYTRDTAGDDVVVAEAVVDERPLTGSVVHVWTVVPGLELTVGPSGGSSRVGTDLTVTATARQDGDPAEGAVVTFRATAGGRTVQSGPVPVDGGGRASWTHSRNSAGPDTVQAVVVLPDGTSGQASMTHLWRDQQGRVVPEAPPAPTLEAEGVLVPGALVTVRGTGCPAGSPVVLTIDDQPVGTAEADDSGGHRTEIVVPALAVGRHSMTGTCLPVRVTRPVDVVVPVAATAAPAAATTTVMTVFSFFVLLGGQLLRFAGGPAGAGS